MRNKNKVVEWVERKAADFDLSRGQVAATALGITASFGAFLLIRRYFREEVKDDFSKATTSHDPIIICPDCGKHVAFRGCCPKCGSKYWIPAGLLAA